MYMYIYAYMYSVFIYIHMYRPSVYACIVFVYLLMYLFDCVLIHAFECMYMHSCSVYINIYTHICTFTYVYLGNIYIYS